MNKVEQATDRQWACLSCGGADIEVALWVSPNEAPADQIGDIVAPNLSEAHARQQTFCVDCDDHTELRSPIWATT